MINRRWPRWPLALTVSALLGSFLYIFCRSRGYFSDEGSYCTIAQGILRGKLPYLSLFNEKPPLQYFWTAAVMAVTRPTLSGARLASAATLTVTALFILLGPARRARNLLAVLAWAALIVLLAIDLYAFRDTAESSLACLFGASALLVANGTETPAKRLGLFAALQGVIFGIAIGFRQTALAPALVMLFLPKTRLPRLPYCCGLVLGIACWLGPLVALGMGPDFVNDTITFHFGNQLALTYLRGPGLQDRAGILLWLLCLAWLASLKHYRANLPWLLLWLIAMALPAMGRVDAFRLWPSMAAMLVLLAQPANEKTSTPAPTSALVAAILSVAFLVAALMGLPHKPPGGTDVASEIARMTRAKDSIWVGPFDPLSYCLAQREPASRYYFLTPWTAKADTRRQIVTDISASLPKLIVVYDGGEAGISRLLPEVLSIVAKNYHAVETREGAIFYERNGGHP